MNTLLSTAPQQFFSSYNLGMTIRIMGFVCYINLDDMFPLYSAKHSVLEFKVFFLIIAFFLHSK